MHNILFNVNVPIDKSDKLFLWLLNRIRRFEKTLFSFDMVVSTSFHSWQIDVENGESIEKVPAMFGQANSRIRLGQGFIKKIYKYAYFIVDYYAINVAGKNCSSVEELVKKIDSSRSNYFRNDDVEWTRIQNERLQKDKLLINYLPVDYVFFYMIHFVINHEMAHTVFLGDGWHVETQCDAVANDVLENLAQMALTRGNLQCVEQIVTGSLLAQVAIASYTKKNVLNGLEKVSSSHPFTFERMNDIVHRWMEYLTKLNVHQKFCIDSFFAYVFIALVFVYQKIDYLSFLSSFTTFCSLCYGMLSYLRNERAIYDSRNYLCPDELIGYVEVKNGAWHFVRRNDFKDVFVFADEYEWYFGEKTSFGAPIILLLESPHKSEFFKKGVNVKFHPNFIFSRPANGFTKRKIDKNIDDVLGNIFVANSPLKHPVLVFNSCQYRCSFGKNTSLYRDWVFKKLFEGTVVQCNKDNLIKRVRRIGQCIVISACTKGNGNVYILRNAVDNCLCANGVPFVKAYHPSSWRNPNCRVKRP